MKDKHLHVFSFIMLIINVLLAIMSCYNVSIFKSVFFALCYFTIMIGYLVYIIFILC